MTASSNDRWISFLCGAVLSAAVILAAFHRAGISALPPVTLCASRLLFGVECPGCGLTRSFIALAAGDLSRAVALNPLGPVLFGATTILLLNHALNGNMRIKSALDAMVVLIATGAIVLRAVAFYAF